MAVCEYVVAFQFRSDSSVGLHQFSEGWKVPQDLEIDIRMYVFVLPIIIRDWSSETAPPTLECPAARLWHLADVGVIEARKNSVQ
jgi:hypothetical protein